MSTKDDLHLLNRKALKKIESGEWSVSRQVTFNHSVNCVTLPVSVLGGLYQRIEELERACKLRRRKK